MINEVDANGNGKLMQMVMGQATFLSFSILEFLNLISRKMKGADSE